MAKKNGVSAEELSGFCAQVTMLLEAGLPMYDGIRTMAESGAESQYKELYASVSEGVQETGSLYEAMKRSDVWPKYLVEMTGIGERSGKLEQVMRGLSRHYEREERIRQAITAAITYPLTLSIMLAAVIFVVLRLVMPVFRRVLDSMGVGIGSSSTAMIRIGEAVGWVVLVVTALFLIAAAVIAILLKTDKREKVRAFLLKATPRVRSVRKKMSASRAVSVLSMTLSGGFAPEESLEMAGSVLEDSEAGESLKKIAGELSEGVSLSDSLAASGLLEDIHARMLRTAAAAGRETDTLEKIAGIYEEEAESGIYSLVSIIEPTLVIVLSVVIGGVLLSVMLPMAGLLTGLI